VISNNHEAEIDLLLTDMVMPGGLSGHKLAQMLQAQSDP
jgi:CheY-like chemotaxis protein